MPLLMLSMIPILAVATTATSALATLRGRLPAGGEAEAGALQLLAAAHVGGWEQPWPWVRWWQGRPSSGLRAGGRSPDGRHAARSIQQLTGT